MLHRLDLCTSWFWTSRLSSSSCICSIWKQEGILGSGSWQVDSSWASNLNGSCPRLAGLQPVSSTVDGELSALVVCGGQAYLGPVSSEDPLERVAY